MLITNTCKLQVLWLLDADLVNIYFVEYVHQYDYYDEIHTTDVVVS